MIDMEALKALALEAGFSYVGALNVDTIELKQEVRDMCADNTCGRYNKCWSCPPGCGELQELRNKIAAYDCGILVQTVGELEDQFDIETMMETEAHHKENMEALDATIRKVHPGVLAIGVGCCTVCEMCTYPDAPCRFPDRQMVSMEASGMVVSEVCRANNMKYYYGPETMSYTSCFLLKQDA